jgi:hypothetical protein
MSLFIPTYFSPVSQYSEIIKSKNIVFEMDDNFQKQSYRNRCYIFNTNGRQLLNSCKTLHFFKEKKNKRYIIRKGNFLARSTF